MKLKHVADEHILVKVDVPEAGSLSLESYPTAVECGEIIGVGKDCEPYKVGQTILFKSWCVDLITMGKEKFAFIDIKTRGIKAIVK